MATLRTHSWLCAATAVAMASMACADGSATERGVATAPATRLAGTWDVRFVLDRSPMLGPVRRTAENVRGRFAFLQNRWLPAPHSWTERPTDYGAYDIDFTPFGFEPRSAVETPTAVARSLPGDSVEIVLGPERTPVTVSMRGKLANDSVAGTWEVSISRAAGGGGRFVMSRHREALAAGAR